MKRVIYLLLAVVFVIACIFTGVGCKEKVAAEEEVAMEESAAEEVMTEEEVVSESVAEAEASESIEKEKVFPDSVGSKIFFQTQLGHPYASALASLVEKEAGIFGYEANVFDMQNDVQTQVNQLETAIVSDYDAIILQPYSDTALNPSFKKAYEKGIPIILAGMEVNEEGMQYVSCFVGSSGVAEGISAGELIVQALNGKGNIVEIEGQPGHPYVAMRGGEAENVIAEKAPDIKILGKETGNWTREDAMTVMENFLTAYGDQIDLVYCHDSNMAMGAIEVLKEHDLNGKILVVSVNGSKEESDAIKAGDMCGTVLNDPCFIAVNAVQRARDLIESRGILSRYISPAVKITLENVDDVKVYF